MAANMAAINYKIPILTLANTELYFLKIYIIYYKQSLILYHYQYVLDSGYNWLKILNTGEMVKYNNSEMNDLLW
jgi:hypothetical protein